MVQGMGRTMLAVKVNGRTERRTDGQTVANSIAPLPHLVWGGGGGKQIFFVT